MMQEMEGSFHYRGSWRETYITSKGLVLSDSKQRFTSLTIQHLYSDLLYQPWYCATLPIQPEWLERDNLERRSNLSAADFRRLFEIPNIPVVITDQVTNDHRPRTSTSTLRSVLPALILCNAAHTARVAGMQS